MNISAPNEENNLAQEHGPQQDGAQVKGQEDRLTDEAQEDRSYEPEAQETGQEYGVQKGGNEHQTQDDGQEDRAHEDGAHEDGVHEDGAYEDGAYEDAVHNDKAQGGRQADEVQGILQEDKAYMEGQDGGAYEDDVREYRIRKRRVMTEESDDGAALRALQVREGRKSVENGKY